MPIRPIRWDAAGAAMCWLAALFIVLMMQIAPVQAQTLPGLSSDETATSTTAEETLQPLLDVLEDPASRDALIEALRASEEAPAIGPDGEPVDAEETLAARLAEASIAGVAELGTQADGVLTDLGRLSRLPDLLTEERLAQIRSEASGLLLTIVVTVLIYRLFRTLSRRVRLTKSKRDATVREKVFTFSIQFVLRLLSVLLAWVGGYLVAASVFSDSEISLAQALYLNAFLVFGLFSLILSIFVSRHPQDVTFVLLPQNVEAAIYKHVRRTFGVLFYGVIAAVPIASEWTNFLIARSVRTIVVTLAAIMALWTIYRISKAIRKARQAAAAAAASASQGTDGESLTGTIVSGSINVWDRVWPWLAYAYVAVAYVVTLANPSQMVELVGRATALSGLALFAVIIGLRLLQQAPKEHRFPVPQAIDSLLPTLRGRLSGFLSPIFVLAGLAAIFAALVLILEGWQLIDTQRWITNGGSNLLWRIASALIILATIIVAWSVLSSWIDRRLSVDEPERQVSARSRTLLALFRNALTISLVVFGGMTALSEIGIDIAPLLAGAGVIGLAIGFGAQKLVQDIITGIFIQLENAINEGDVVTVAGITGSVESLTIRSVGIRDLSGVYHLIPFSAVDTVGNYMRLFAYHVEVVGIAYDSDIEVAEKAMFDAFDVVKNGPMGIDIIDPLEFHGVIALGDSSVNLRARIKTRPGKQWAIGRAYTREVKVALDAAGIEIPFPHRELKLPKALLDRLAGPQVIEGTSG